MKERSEDGDFCETGKGKDGYLLFVEKERKLLSVL